MNRKLVFLDVDGTFTAPGGYEPPESAVRAVKRGRELGHKVFLCSGRNYGALSPLNKYGFDGGIASCGGYVYAGEDVLYDCPLTEEQQEKLKDGNFVGCGSLYPSRISDELKEKNWSCALCNSYDYWNGDSRG